MQIVHLESTIPVPSSMFDVPTAQARTSRYIDDASTNRAQATPTVSIRTSSVDNSDFPQLVIAGTTCYPAITSPRATAPIYILHGQTLALSKPITLGPDSAPTPVALTSNAAGQTILVVAGSTSTLETENMGGSVRSALNGPIDSSAATAEETSSVAAVSNFILTISLSDQSSEEFMTASAIASSVFIIPGINGGWPQTITAGGKPATLLGGIIFSAASSGVVVSQKSVTNAVAAETDVVNRKSSVSSETAKRGGAASHSTTDVTASEMDISTASIGTEGQQHQGAAEASLTTNSLPPFLLFLIVLVIV